MAQPKREATFDDELNTILLLGIDAMQPLSLLLPFNDRMISHLMCILISHLTVTEICLLVPKPTIAMLAKANQLATEGFCRAYELSQPQAMALYTSPSLATALQREESYMALRHIEESYEWAEGHAPRKKLKPTEATMGGTETAGSTDGTVSSIGQWSYTGYYM